MGDERWIFCGGMPRSGSTLQLQLTSHLVEAAGLGSQVEWVPPEEWSRLRDRYASDGRWHVFKTHRLTPEIATELASGGAVALHVYRDIRDVIASRMRLRGQDFRSVARSIRPLVEMSDRWLAVPGVLVTRYETLVADPATEVERIAAHLGLTVDRQEAEMIASQYSLEQQRQRIDEAVGSGRVVPAPHGSLFDPVTNLHVEHIGSGRPSAWHQVLSPAETSVVEHRAGAWLRARGYRLSMSPWSRTVRAATWSLGVRVSAASGRSRAPSDASDASP